MPTVFREKLVEVLDYHNFVLVNYLKSNPVSVDEVFDSSLKMAERLKPIARAMVPELFA